MRLLEKMLPVLLYHSCYYGCYKADDKSTLWIGICLYFRNLEFFALSDIIIIFAVPSNLVT